MASSAPQAFGATPARGLPPLRPVGSFSKLDEGYSGEETPTPGPDDAARRVVGGEVEVLAHMMVASRVRC